MSAEPMLFPVILSAMLHMSATDTQCEAFEDFVSAPSIETLTDWQSAITE